jgi:hypothetical protein
VALKVAIVLPGPTVTEAGTVNAAALLDRVTVAPPVFETSTTHSEVAAEVRLAGTHVKELTTVAADRAMVAVTVLPFSVAVMVAVWLPAIDAVVTVKLPDVLPAATITEAGTVNAAALLDSATVAPAAFDTVATHVERAPDPKIAAVHDNPLTTTWATSATAAVCVAPFSVAVMVAV